MPSATFVPVMEKIFLGGSISEAQHSLRESQGSSRAGIVGLSLIIFFVVAVGMTVMFGHLNAPANGGFSSTTLPSEDNRVENFALAMWDAFVTLAVVMFTVGIYALMTSKGRPDASAYSDTRLVGSLAETLRSSDHEMRQTAAQALIRLLPTLRASDTGLLNIYQRSSLNRALTENNTALVLAILRAYEQVGDRNALPYVTALAEGQYTGRSNTQVREAARSCLPYLEVQEQQVQHARTLLRPSSGESVTQELLLRPAGTSAEVEATQLLRSAEGSI